jgi:hypothetical protein
MFFKKEIFKRLNKILILLLVVLASCTLPSHSGFYAPVTLDVTVPDGPPEFKAGYHDGCKTGLGIGTHFVNGKVYRRKGGPEFGSGVYSHDPVYQSAWGQGYYACHTHIANFVGNYSTRFAPFD